jgi:hypothetical protein
MDTPLRGLGRWIILAGLTCWTLSTVAFAHMITDGAHGITLVIVGAAFIGLLWVFSSQQPRADPDGDQAVPMAGLMALCLYVLLFPAIHQAMGMLAVVCGIVFVIAVGQVVELVARAIARPLAPFVPEAPPGMRIAVSVVGAAVAITAGLLAQSPGAIAALGDVHRMPYDPLDYTPALQVAEPTTTWIRGEMAGVWQSATLGTSIWGVFAGGGQIAERLAA